MLIGGYRQGSRRVATGKAGLEKRVSSRATSLDLGCQIVFQEADIVKLGYYLKIG